MTNRDLPRARIWSRRMAASALWIWLATLTTGALMLVLALWVIRDDVTRAASATTRAVGVSVAEQVRRAVVAGVPLDKLVGMEAFLDGMVEAGARIQALSVVAPGGQTLYAASRPGPAGPFPIVTETPILLKGQPIASVRVGIAAGGSYERAIFLLGNGFVGVALVAMLVLELVRGVVRAAMIRPMLRVARSAARAGGGVIAAPPLAGDASALEAAFAMRVRALGAQRAEIDDLAVAVRAGHFNREVHRRIGAIIADLDQAVWIAPEPGGGERQVAQGPLASADWWRIGPVLAVVVLAAVAVALPFASGPAVALAAVALGLVLVHLRAIMTEFGDLDIGERAG